MMTPDQLNAFCERFVIACEKIAESLEGLHEIERNKFRRQFPERREVREAILTRVPTEEDRIRENIGGQSGIGLDQWLSGAEEESDSEQEEDIGAHEREWLQQNQPSRLRTQAPPRHQRSSGGGSADNVDA